MVVKTRSERHIKNTDPRKSPLTNMVPLVGIAMVGAPTVISLAPSTVYANEDGVANAQSLINQIGTAASEIANQNDLYASVMIAQALLESGNGSSVLSSAPYYNLFGVKAYNGGATVWLPTQEYLNGQWVTMTEPFRQYNSYYESLVDHANVLLASSSVTGQARYAGAWKSQTTSYYDATAYLTGRYATDPNYNQKLNSLIQRYNLTQYDTPSYYTQTTTTTTTTTTTYQATATYTVAQGDTLWGIAQKFGVSVDQLVAQNNISGELIVVGQQLSI